jgi:hypothetical protein
MFIMGEVAHVVAHVKGMGGDGPKNIPTGGAPYVTLNIEFRRRKVKMCQFSSGNWFRSGAWFAESC